MRRILLVAAVLVTLVVESGCSSRADAVVGNDLAAAQQQQARDHLPILALLLGQDEPLPIDLDRWLEAEPALLPHAHLVVLWREDPRSQMVAALAQGSFIARLPPRKDDHAIRPSGSLAASLYPLPRSHAGCRDALAADAAGLPPAPEIDLRSGEEALLAATREVMTSWAVPLPGQVKAFSHAIDASLTRPLDVGHALLLAVGISLEHDHDHEAKLMAELWQQLPQAHDTFEIELTMADCLMSSGDITGASEAYRRIGEARIEAPMVAQTARSQLANLQVDASTSRRHFEDRAAEDIVVLVPDLRSYLAAISGWTPERFYPVLIEDDRFASRFIAAYHPSAVLRMARPSLLGADAGGTAAGPAPAAGGQPMERMARAVLTSWGAGADADSSLEGQRRQLASLGITPDGLVVIDPGASEAAGAVALAAGRFQGLVAVPTPSTGAPARPAGCGDRLARTEAYAFAHTLEACLDRWAPPADAWRYLTLGARYPYRWIGSDPNDQNYALDDLIGRDHEGVRTAVVGRLVGDRDQAIYQAMCSLFLQPRQALLVDTYNQNPYSSFGSCRLTPIRDALNGVVASDLLVDPAIGLMRQHWTPWCAADLVMIVSAGGPDWWMIPGSGTAEDIPIGVPRAMTMDHSYSCANPYDPDTIAGRALWGGTYLYYGSVSEPMLNAFEDAVYIGCRLKLGLPWSTVLRTHGGDWGQQPWKLMLVGDPRFALRLHAQARERPSFERLEHGAAVTPDGGASSLAHLRNLRLVGSKQAIRLAIAGLDSSTMDGDGLVLAIESCLLVDDLDAAEQLWDAAPAEVRSGADAMRLVRIATLTRLDRALAAGDAGLAQQAISALLAQHPPENVLERCFEQLCDSASSHHQEEPWAAWLRAQAAGAGEHAPLLQAWADRAGLTRLLALTSWRDADADAAVAALVQVARSGRWNGQLAAWVDTACQRWSTSSGDGPDHILSGLHRAAAGVQPLLDAVAAIEAQRPYTRDWLLMGPFTNAAHGAWEAVESHAGAIDPQAHIPDADGSVRSWIRPYRARDFGPVDLLALLGNREYVHAYAASLVDVATATDGWLLLGSDDGATVWLDGKVILHNSAPRSLTLDQDRVRVHLTAGVHTLLLAIDQITGGWAFAARWSQDQEGKRPLAGVTLRSPLVNAQAAAQASQVIP